MKVKRVCIRVCVYSMCNMFRCSAFHYEFTEREKRKVKDRIKRINLK